MCQFLPELVSVSASGGSANGESAEPAISADGRFVAFYSKATNLVTSGPSGNIFVRDTCLGAQSCTPQTTGRRLGHQRKCAQLSFERASSYQLPMADSSLLRPQRRISLLVPMPLDKAVAARVYLRDLCEGDDVPAGCVPQTQLVSVDPLGAPVSGAFPVASSDGRFVAFVSTPTAAPAATAAQAPRIYVRDTCAGPTANSKCEPTTISVDLNGSDPAAAASLAISGDGRYVARQHWSVSKR